jgi:NADPH:quinone reductase-like Zn-dependent oxidoreductase
VHAVVVTRHGGPDVLEPRELPDPEPGSGEVLVELRAAAVNRRDAFVREGIYDFPLPLVPGSDGAGVRRDTGEEVVIMSQVGWGEGEDAPAPGQTTLGGPGQGTYAELIAVPEENLFARPPGLSWEETASLPVAGGTAWRALFGRGQLQEGETVLVLGAGSGVSTFLVQMAAEVGARVLVTSSSEEKIERAREIGADGGVLYTDADWPEAVRELSGGQGVDLVLDSVGSTWNDSLRTLRPGGRAVVFGGTGGTRVELDVRPFYFGQLALLGTMGSSPREFGDFLAHVERAGWRPVIDRVYELDEAAEAHRRLEAGEQFGKLVLRVSGR